MEVYMPNDHDTIANVEAATEIAAAMGLTVKAVSCYYFTLVDESDRGYHFNTRKSPGRYEISGLWPYSKLVGSVYPSERDQSPSIGVSKSRGVNAIVSDIRKRFDPYYLPLYDKMVANVQRQESQLQKKNETLEKLSALAGTKLSPQEKGSHYFTAYLIDIQKVQVWENDLVSLEIRVSSDLAAEIIEMMAKRHPKQ